MDLTPVVIDIVPLMMREHNILCLDSGSNVSSNVIMFPTSVWTETEK